MMLRALFLIATVVALMPGIHAQPAYQLAPPLLWHDGKFFTSSTRLSFEFRHPGSEIRYTTDGSDPSLSSPWYTGPIDIHTHLTTIRARAFAPGYAPSDPVGCTFYGAGIPIRVLAASEPHHRYAGQGPKALNDLQSGGTNHNSTAWLGYQTDSILVRVSLDNPARVGQLLLHVLNSPDAWIFPPSRVKVYAVNGGVETLLATQDIAVAQASTPAADTALIIPLPDSNPVSQLRLAIYPLMSLPAWHPGKGNPAWCFIDEIKIYPRP